VRKESYQIVRDPNSVLIAFVLPIILLFIFGCGVSLDATRTRVGLVVENMTPVTLSLAPRFQASPYFEVINGHDGREFVPGAIAIVMALVGTLLTSLVIAREWERGTMKAMVETPVTAVELLAGKIMPYFVLGLASMTKAASCFEAGFDLAEQSRQVDGLGVEIRAADLDAFGAIRRQRVRGQCDDRDRRGLRSGLDQ
jgi:hypothetical protein